MIFFGHVTPAGILELDHLELYGDLLKGRLAYCRVQIDIDRKKTPRSQQQSAYLWAAVYGWITRDDSKSDFVILISTKTARSSITWLAQRNTANCFSRS